MPRFRDQQTAPIRNDEDQTVPIFRKFHSLKSPIVRALAIPLVLATLAVPAIAQDDDDDGPLPSVPQGPLAIINIASLDRVLGDIGYLFEAADRADMMEVLEGQLDRVGQLEGLDRTRPMGMMVYLREGFPPQPEVVGYFPVSDIRDLSKTLEIGPVSVQRVPESEDRYELKGPNQTFQVKMLHDYAFVSNNGDVLDRELGDPVKQVQALTDKYDFAAQIDITTVPLGLRQIFMTFLRNSSLAELQQRDEESDAAYAVRKANGESTIIFLEQLVTQCDAITFGMDASKEEKAALFDVSFRASPNSTFSQYLTDVAGKRSFFECLLSEESPLSFSLSWNMDSREKKAMKALLSAGKESMKEAVDEPEDVEGPVHDVFASLGKTADKGHLDMFVQFLPSDETKLVLIGAVRMEDADRMAGAMRELLSRVTDSPDLAKMELDIDSHAGITFHRIQGAEIREQDARMYGEDPGLYVGVGRNSIWFSVGADDALDELKGAIDTAIGELQNPVDRTPAAPFQIVAHVLPWMELQGEVADASIQRELAQDAFGKGDDRIKLDFQPTDDGARLRLQFDEAFMRFLGMTMSTQYDLRQL